MPKIITLDFLKELFFPLQFKLDKTKECPVFWRQIQQNDSRSKYAFSILTGTLNRYSFRLEGLNEPRLLKQVKAGKIVLETAEELEDYREVLFETTLEEVGRLKDILQFLLLQIEIIEKEHISSSVYSAALKNIELIVAAANQFEID